MKKTIVLIVGCIIAQFAIAEVSDDEISRIVEYSSRIDNGRDSTSEMRYAMRLCGYDTNRFVRVLQELAIANPALKEYIIAELCSFGNSTALPFLYQSVTNSTNLEIGESASLAILKIEGITSNSIAHIDRFLKMPQNNKLPGREVCGNVIMYAKRPNVSPTLKSYAVNCVINYASRNNFYPDYIDGLIISADSTYRMSKRRLATLRAVASLGVHVACTNYVTNAINELVAYPEADLPE